mgnify:CR=1 FL=1
MPRDTLIQVRRGTLSQWLSSNPTLANGELGFITDQCRLVVGKNEVDFSGLWNSDSCVIPQTGLQLGGGGDGTISNAFRYVNVNGETVITASGEATLNFIEGSKISLVGVSGTNSVTFAVTGIKSTDISDFTPAVTGVVASQFETDLLGGKNIELSYNTISDNLFINTTGVVVKSANGDVVIGRNLDVVGNLTVAGSSIVANSTDINIGTNLITLNIVNSVPSGGLRVVRSGILPTGFATFLWQEYRDRWEASHGLFSPNIFADTITATHISGTFIGDVAGSAECATNVSFSNVDPTGVRNALVLSNTSATGCAKVILDPALYYNASGNTLISPFFSGALLGTANIAKTINVSATDADTNYNIVLVNPLGPGSSLVADSGLNLYFNPLQNKLYSSYINSPLISGASVGPDNAGINNFILTNYYIRSSKVDGGSP